MRRRGMSQTAIEVALLAENELRCRPPLPEADVRRIAASIRRYATAPAANGSGSPRPPFGEPQSLPSEIPAVLPFDHALLPDNFRPWIQDISERIQCPPDFPAVAAMVALSAIVGRKVGIRPKRRDDWLVVPNLW